MPESLWWQRGVIYQIYPRSYRDSDGNGIGDLAGIIEKLDYLQRSLPVDAIWLSPIYPSPMADFGYDVADYTNIDPIFGDLATFDRLVKEAHRRDLQVIIDFVPNHTSSQHPWFLESRSSRHNPKRDWYVWRDPKPDGSPPNNWLALFGGKAWEWDEHTGQYYLHSFLKEQPDLNWRNPEVKTAMFDVVRFWLERGVDGFRIDVAHFIMKDPELRDNPPDPDWKPGPSSWEYASELHIHDKGHPDVHGVYRDLRRLLDEYSADRPRMMVGEIHIFDWPVWAQYYGAANDEFHLPFNFGLLDIPWQVRAVREVVDGVNSASGEVGGWPNYVLGNHDTHRIASRIGQAQARVAMMLLLTLRGTPTMYYGDELGMEDVSIPPDRIQDPFEKLTPGLGLGRDPERTPMQWDPSPHGGFTAADAEPWLPLAANFGAVNVTAELEDPHSMLALTRQLLQLRRQHRALHSGGYTPLDCSVESCLTFLRDDAGDRFLIALNFADREVEIPFTYSALIPTVDGKGGTLVLSTHLDRSGPVDLGRFTLRANEGCLVRLDGTRPSG